MSPEEPGQDPENPPLLPFSQLYPDLFAHLTPDQAQPSTGRSPAAASRATTTPAPTSRTSSPPSPGGSAWTTTKEP